MSRKNSKGRLTTVLAWLRRSEDIVLSFLLLLTLGIAVSQIILRNFLNTSLVWGDILVRVLVLWIGMLGAMIATRENKHISVDLISRYLSPFSQAIASAVVSFFAGGICALAGYHSLLFVISEYQAGEIAFAGTPAWICEAILPAAFTIMALRYWIQCGIGLARLERAGPP